MFSHHRQVEYADTDMAGIVHYSEFFRYMESAEHAFLRSLGLSVSMDVGDRRISWPRVSCAFDFRKPLRFEDEFEIRLTIEKIGGKSVTFRADIMRNGEELASGRSTSVCCQMEPEGSMTAVAIPDQIRSKLKEAMDEGGEVASNG
jgi:acyl-CoA thioester hydrolase